MKATGPLNRWKGIQSFIGSLAYSDRRFYEGEIQTEQGTFLPHGRGVMWSADGRIIGSGIWDEGAITKK